jgi:xylan 1,4-beta-xylosidase
MGVNIRKLSSIIPHRHENLIEITLCLLGEIKFSSCFEEFTLKPGEFILVDKDVHYLHGGEAVCASFYIDLNFFKEKYPFIDGLIFVCEGTSDSTVPYDTYYHQYIKSILLALLFFISRQSEKQEEYKEKITSTAEKIVNLMMDRFDIIFYYNPGLNLKPGALERYRDAMKYIHDHDSGKVLVKEVAGHCGVSSAYMSEFLGNITLGFRTMIGYTRTCKSEKYLMDTDMSIVEISEICGFSDAKYYYEAFKTWYHCTPGQFRKKYKKEMERGNIEESLPIREIEKPLEEMMEKHLIDMFL